MSPEIQDKKRTSAGWAKHERKRKSAERKIAKQESFPITTKEDRQRKLNTPSWASVRGLLNLATSNNYLLHSVYEQLSDYTEERTIVKGWYDASFKDATTGDGKDSKYRDEFKEKHMNSESQESFDRIIILRTTPLIKMVDSFMFRGFSKKK